MTRYQELCLTPEMLLHEIASGGSPCGIILNLLSIPGYYDVALRDFGLALAAVALARLAREFDERSWRGAAVPETERAMRSSVIVQFLTSEHFVLQSARAATVNDVNGRASIFLGTVSAGIVALAFLAQASQLGPPFYAFALVLFPSLAFLGFATLARALQSSIEDTIYARGMNRIRRYFVEQAPDVLPYLIQSTHDDTTGVMSNAGLHLSRWQMWLTTAGMIAMITALLVGISASLLAVATGRMNLVGRISVGALAFAAVLIGLNRYQQRRWAKFDRQLEVHFPTPGSRSPHDGRPDPPDDPGRAA